MILLKRKRHDVLSYADMKAQQWTGVPIEDKTVDLNPTEAAITSTANLILLNGIAQGTTDYTRVGSQIYNKQLELRLKVMCTKSPVAGDTGTTARIAVVWDKQPTGALPTYADIFTCETAAGTAVSDIFSFPNTTNEKRFCILKDYYYEWNVSTKVAGAESETVNVNKGISTDTICLNSWATTFSGTTSGIASIATGALYLVRLTNNAGTVVTVKYAARVTMSDTLD